MRHDRYSTSRDGARASSTSSSASYRRSIRDYIPQLDCAIHAGEHFSVAQLPDCLFDRASNFFGRLGPSAERRNLAAQLAAVESGVMSYSFLSSRGRQFRFPGPRDRVTINGMTGSGKSTFALWLFAESADFDKKPWIFIDFKSEDIIQQALREDLFETLDIGGRIPKKPGVHVVSHNPRDGQQPVIDFLWKIYEAGRIGLFVDEATMIPEVR